MHVKRQCSINGNSELVKLFVQRSGSDPRSTPEDVIESLAGDLRRRKRFAARPVLRLDPFLKARNVVDFEVAPILSCDGYLEARGRTFADGFRMVVRRDTSNERVRFTIAHELCHTFFYELVPELKFRSQGADNYEEALCNLGAAAFLMPSRGLRQRATNMPVSIESLELLAEQYGVSIKAMFVRLRALRAWTCEMSVWQRSTKPAFKLQRLYGGRSLDYRWSDDSVPQRVWESGKAGAGPTTLQYFDSENVSRSRAVSCQLVRRGDSLIAIWGDLRKPTRTALPLFDGQRKASSK